MNRQHVSMATEQRILQRARLLAQGDSQIMAEVAEREAAVRQGVEWTPGFSGRQESFAEARQKRAELEQERACRRKYQTPLRVLVCPQCQQERQRHGTAYRRRDEQGRVVQLCKPCSQQLRYRAS